MVMRAGSWEGRGLALQGRDTPRGRGELWGWGVPRQDGLSQDSWLKAQVLGWGCTQSSHPAGVTWNLPIQDSPGPRRWVRMP